MAPWVFQLFFSQSFVDSGAFWFHPTRQALLAIPTRKRRKGRPRTRRRDSSPTCLVSSWCRASRNIRGCWKRWVFLILLRLLASRNSLCTFFAQKMWLQFHVVLVKRYIYTRLPKNTGLTRNYPRRFRRCNSLGARNSFCCKASMTKPLLRLYVSSICIEWAKLLTNLPTLYRYLSCLLFSANVEKTKPWKSFKVS